MKEANASPSSRRTADDCQDMLKERKRGRTEGRVGLDQAIKEGSMNWVVAAFQGVGFVESARSKGEMLLNYIAMAAAGRKVEDTDTVEIAALESMNAKGKEVLGREEATGQVERKSAQSWKPVKIRWL
jgi:hypothetical protein